MTRTSLPPYEFHAQHWEAVAARATELASAAREFAYLVDLVNSIRTSGVGHRLAGRFSMMDLHVTELPIHQPPIEYLAVSGSGSPLGPANGLVRVEHHTTSGKNDSIERPSADVVPLFWRFVREKFGILSAAAETSSVRISPVTDEA